jgi:alpha-galactosidase
LNWIEAESGALDGSAKKTSCAGCSGGSSVGSISQTSGSVTFSNIKTSQATQDVRLDYINCEVNYSFAGVGPNYLAASISVNGGAGVSVQLPLTGYNCGVDVLKNFLVRLSGFNTSGANTIKISGLSGNDGTKNAPIIDRIGVVA